MNHSRVGIDIGGTFTDVITVDAAGNYVTIKLATTPHELAECFGAGVAKATAKFAIDSPPTALLYGTTLATNALLEHRLAPIALIVTAGFREILEINGVHDADHHEPGGGHTHRYRLVPLEHVFEVDERIEGNGAIRRALDPRTLATIGNAIVKAGIRCVAVSLLHSTLNPSHELGIRESLARTHPALRVVLSSEVLPELREYERTVTTCLNTALLPVLGDHLQGLATIHKAPLYLMKSSGGLTPVANALNSPLATALSGPSAAVVGASHLAQRLMIPAAITLDIGGTSTDVALLKDGLYAVTSRAELAGFPLKNPAVDVLSIGAGGGSIAWLGADQRWHLGPHSAGADPGPACYGKGGVSATLTDAHLVLGRLPEALLGGELPLDRDAASRALAEFGRARHLDALATAQGLLKIASQSMCGAIRRVSVQRGHDPTAHALFALGGAGALHAAELAALLGIDKVIVPRYPGFAAAYGLLTADIREDAVLSVAQTEHALDIPKLQAQVERLEAQVRDRLTPRGAPRLAAIMRRSADLRYVGMSAEFSVAVSAEPLCETTINRAFEAFHQQYERFTGHAYRGTQAVEIVNVRVTGGIELAKPPPVVAPKLAATPVPTSIRPVYFLDCTDLIDCPIYARDDLGYAVSLRGPAIVEQYDATILVPPTWSLSIDQFGNVVLDRLIA